MSLKNYRQKAGLTQLQLAEAAGVSQSQITHHECGRRANISLGQARAIVRALNDRGVKCSLDSVFPCEEAKAA
ncbi:Helix-turn-helix domain-containing protein [Alcanivorax sp. DSM 26293]|jgi:putative transcriptional regulator|uniref:helix-turn-helix transcriptional regulator n=1 Tax=Alcanivorax sp. DSM 26293 TaxID=1798238 RepID=UPI0008A05152|nr:helix-turn-helix transcriptional regulator [Alcanivorax sp. DSM 26293]SEF44436.1 Helix-turn-helix domain-containing protein [Alcanivorax sp. DSM 26293]